MYAEEHDTGTARWTRDTYTTHQITFTLPDDALSAVQDEDGIKIGVQGRKGFVLLSLTPQQVRRLMET